LNNKDLHLHEINLYQIKKCTERKCFFNYLDFIYSFLVSENIGTFNFSKFNLIVMQSHHADNYFDNFVKIFLPSKFFYEKSLFFINILGYFNNLKYLNLRYILNGAKED
jgi:hypothetical protein